MSIAQIRNTARSAGQSALAAAKKKEEEERKRKEAERKRSASSSSSQSAAKNRKSTDTRANGARSAARNTAAQAAKQATKKAAEKAEEKVSSSSGRAAKTARNTAGKAAEKIREAPAAKRAARTEKELQGVLDRTTTARDILERQNVRANSYYRNDPFTLPRERTWNQLVQDQLLNRKLSGQDPGKPTFADVIRTTQLSPLNTLKADSVSKASFRYPTIPSKRWDEGLTDKEKVKEGVRRLGEQTKKDRRGRSAAAQTLSKPDQKLRKQFQDEIAMAKADFDSAKARGDAAGMAKAHQRAETWRRLEGGYSGGVAGDEYITEKLDREDISRLNKTGQTQLKAAKMGWKNAQTDGERALYAAMGQDIRNNPAYLKEPYDRGAYRDIDAEGRMRYAGTPEERKAEGKQLSAIPKAIGTGIAGSFLSIPGTTGRALHTDAARNRGYLQNLSDIRGDGEINISEPEQKKTPQEMLAALRNSDRYQNASAISKANKLARTMRDIHDQTPVGQRLLSQADRYRQQATEGQKGLERYLTEAIITGGEMIPGLAATALTGGMAAPGLAVMGAQAAGQKMGSLEAAGTDPVEAFNRGVVAGAIEAATEKIPLGNLTKMAKGGGKSFARNMLTQALEEVGTEELSEIGGYLADKAFRDPNASLTKKDLMDTAAISLLTSLGMGAGAGMIGTRSTRTPRQREQAPQTASLTAPTAEPTAGPVASPTAALPAQTVPAAQSAAQTDALTQREAELRARDAVLERDEQRALERMARSTDSDTAYSYFNNQRQQAQQEREAVRQELARVEAERARRAEEEAARQIAPAPREQIPAPQNTPQEAAGGRQTVPAEEQVITPARQENTAEWREIAEEWHPRSPGYNTPENHIDSRREGNVSLGDRKVMAFQWDHPEMKPFYRKAAQALLIDADQASRNKYTQRANKTKQARGVQAGTVMEKNEPIQMLLDMDLSTTDIIKACEAIINDKGQENYAAAKRVELALDYMLSSGYQSLHDYTRVEPDEAYRLAKSKIAGGTEIGSWEEYRKEHSLELDLGDVTEDRLRQEWEDRRTQPGEPASEPTPAAEPQRRDYASYEEEKAAIDAEADRLMSEWDASDEGRYMDRYQQLADWDREAREKWGRREETGPTETDVSQQNPQPVKTEQPREPMPESISKNVDTNSPEFRQWFKSSRVTRPDGAPKLMYHGTSKYGFDRFDPYSSSFGLFGYGSYFTEDPSVAKSYTKKGKGQKPGVYTAYLSIQNPIDMDAPANMEEWVRGFRENDELDLSYLRELGEHPTNADCFRALKENLADLGYYKYDGEEAASSFLQYTLGYDGVTHIGGGRFNKKDETRHRVYIAFDDDQIQVVSGRPFAEEEEQKNTTQNQKSNGYFAENAEKPSGQDRYSVGAAPSGFDEYSHMQNEYGTIEPGENPARMVDVPKSTDGEDRVRRWARTVMEAEATPDEAIEAFEQDVANGLFSYRRRRDEDAFNAAVNTIEKKGYDGALNQWQDVVEGNRMAGKDDIVLAQMLYSLAARNKDLDTARRLAAEIAAEGTVAGQKVQALRLLKKATPEGRLYYIRRCVDKIQSELNEQQGDKAPELEIDPELEENLLDAETQEEQEDALDAIYDHVAQQLPRTFGARLNAWRYFAMLGNPRTHIRNIVGNLIVQVPLQAGNKASALVQAALPREKRTRALFTSREAKRFAREDYKVMRDVLSNGDKYLSDESEIRRRQKLFKGPLQKVMDVNSAALEAEDTFFKKGTYIHDLANFITAKGWDVENLTEDQLEQARSHAIKEAKHATFQDASAFATWLAKQENKNKAAKVVIGGLMPFKGVPINIAKMGFELSPAGLMKAVTYDAKQVKNGQMEATDMIDHLTRGMTGSAIAGLGYFLAAQGLLTAGGGDDEKEENFEMAQGSQNYALDLGNLSYTLDWAAPSAIPLFLGAEFYNAWQKMGEEGGGEEDEGKRFKAGMEAMTRIFDPMLNMTVLSGVSGALKSVAYSKVNAIFPLAWSVGQNYAGQFVPTLFGQIARTVDDTRRTTFADKSSRVPDSLQKFIQKQENKIPGLSQRNLPWMDVWGREDREENPFLRAFENFLSPGYISRKNTSEMEKELKRLNEAGFDGVLPAKAKTSTKVNDKYLTKEQYETLVKTQGGEARNMLTEVVNSPEYHVLTDEEKAAYVKKIFDFSQQEGKLAVGMPEEKADKYVLNAREGKETLGLDPAKFLALYVTKSMIDKDETEEDKTMKAIDFNLAVDAREDLNEEQKAFVKDRVKFFNMFPVSTSGFEKGLAAGLTAEESKEMLKLKKTADTDGNGGYTNAELYDVIQSTGKSEEEKAKLWDAMKPANSNKSWNDLVKESKAAAAQREQYKAALGDVPEEKVAAFTAAVDAIGGYNQMSYTAFFDTMDSLGIPEKERANYYALVQSNKGHPWKRTYAQAKKYKNR